MQLTDEQRATIVAALRLYQREDYCVPSERPDWLDDIATNIGALEALDDSGVDDLIADLQLPQLWKEI